MTTTTWHESGHCIFGSLYRDFLRVQSVTNQPGSYGQGVTLIETIEQRRTILNSFQFIVVNLAGLVVELVQRRDNNDDTFRDIFMYLNRRFSSDNTVRDTFDGDFEIMVPSIDYLVQELDVDRRHVVVSALSFISNCLREEPIIWTSIQAVAMELDRRHNLSAEDINNILNQTGLVTLAALHSRVLNDHALQILNNVQE